MKKRIVWFLIPVVMLVFKVNSVAQTMPKDSMYLGQKPPGSKAEIFAPNRISKPDRLETYPAISRDGTEIYFSVVNAAWAKGEILYTKFKNGKWTMPKSVPFTDNKYINWESSLSPDNKRMFFASNKPPSINMDIWMTERLTDTTWSEPKRLESPINSNSEDGSVCEVNNGAIYFKSSRGGGIQNSWLYKSVPVNGIYSNVESLGNIINTGAKETEPYMAPDESYLIFISQSRKGGLGGWDLWICFKKEEGGWTKPVNMGSDINTPDDEYGPRVTVDGKYLFFTREKRGVSMDIFWISADMIEKLRHTN